MKQYIISIHSFVDLITNSSTEIYVSATTKTISTLQQLIDEFLKMGKSKLKCDDLFKLSLKRTCNCLKEDNLEYLEEEERKEVIEEHERGRCEQNNWYNIVGTLKGEEIQETKQVLKLLKTLTDSFEGVEAER